MLLPATAPTSRTSKPAAVTSFGVAGAGAFALTVAYANPSSRLRSVVPPCPFHALTGYYCPGCGSTRALHALVHGHIGVAVSDNVLFVVALPFVLAYFALVARNVATGRESLWPALSISPRIMWAIVVAVLSFWVLRNVPVAPFSWLAPN